MKIVALDIRNFKAARQISLQSLGDVVVIAGPNGCGKSCILDAIRFLKSVYAGYRQQNEWHAFFNEFQLDMNNPDEVRRVFYDKAKPVEISAEFALADSEKAFVRANAEARIAALLRQHNFGSGSQGLLMRDPAVEARVKKLTASITERTAEYTRQVLEEIDRPTVTATVTLDATPFLATRPSVLLELLFGMFDPANIGIIDNHSASRAYHRQKLGGINVNIEETAAKLAQHALFNWQNKYTDIKNELAAAFIRDLFIEKAQGSGTRTPSILETMEELFQIFLPDKKFEGPRPGKSGELSFPVTLAGGGEHDIDDLSSGEKELVYGYLRLRNVAPSNSIILLDEPELHLNPRLVLGLPGFYRKHLGLELNNQLWMTTHSDAFLRDAFKDGGFTVFHMSAPQAISKGNQCAAISADDEINRAMFDLVGDIAGFRPGNKVVIFESSESASFDASVTRRLFPEFSDHITALSGDNKFGVKQLYAALHKAAAQMSLPFRIYAICDRDSDQEGRPLPTQLYAWNAYHIVNYLMDERFIAKVMSDFPTYANAMDETAVNIALVSCARDCLGQLIKHKITSHIFASLSSCMDLGYAPAIQDPAVGLAGAAARVSQRVERKVSDQFSTGQLEVIRKDIQSALEASLSSGDWRRDFRGRDILKLFAGRYLSGLPYEAFRDAIVARMGAANHRPAGMADIIDKITRD